MTQHWLFQLLLSPLSLIYGVAVSIRNALYEAEIIRPNQFSIPLISIGNLTIGGAGKSPHIEFLIQKLNPYINVGVLSRGYNRATKGYRPVFPSDTPENAGDEPLMFARKYPDVQVAVSENRALAIPQMIGRNPNLQTVLLDDAFQHRSVQPYINILLTQHEKLFTDDYLLPSGRLREWRSAYKRADFIIVTKCPENLTEEDRLKIERKINLQPHQYLYFSKYHYFTPYSIYNPQHRLPLSPEMDLIVVSAIANTSYMLQYLTGMVKSHVAVEFSDHHYFTEEDIDQIVNLFQRRETDHKIILTTEKDAIRLAVHLKRLYEAKVPIYVLPVGVEMLFGEEENFVNTIKTRLAAFEV